MICRLIFVTARSLLFVIGNIAAAHGRGVGRPRGNSWTGPNGPRRDAGEPVAAGAPPESQVGERGLLGAGYGLPGRLRRGQAPAQHDYHKELQFNARRA